MEAKSLYTSLCKKKYGFFFIKYLSFIVTLKVKET